MFNFFQKSNSNTTRTEKTFKPTKKLKKTYEAKFDGLMVDLSFWSECESTPLPVIKINGQPVRNTGTWMNATKFQNPGASEMLQLYKSPKWREIVGEKYATTIVEYLDKDTGEPALQIYPSGIALALLVDSTDEQSFESYIKNHFNHATRQDITKQQKIVSEKMNTWTMYNNKCR